MCTIEKANSLVNRMMEEDSLSTLGALVVDELHMVRTCCWAWACLTQPVQHRVDIELVVAHARQALECKHAARHREQEPQ